jgi:hypothetical protein
VKIREDRKTGIYSDALVVVVTDLDSTIKAREKG